MGTAAPEKPVETLLEEYQDYVMAHRLRGAIGGRVAPQSPRLASLGEYARLRLERQDLARKLVRKEIPLAGLRQIDLLTEQTHFGFWRNPSEVAAFLRAVLRDGGHPLLSNPAAFNTLLSAREVERLGAALPLVARFYQSCFHLAAHGIDPAALEQAYARVESVRLPLFVDEVVGAE